MIEFLDSAESSDDSNDDAGATSAAKAPVTATLTAAAGTATGMKSGNGAGRKYSYAGCWKIIKDLTIDQVTEKYPEVAALGCDAIRLHRGQRSWASMLAGQGILGMYDTKDEAIKRAVCAALVLNKDINKNEHAGHKKHKKKSTTTGKYDSVGADMEDEDCIRPSHGNAKGNTCDKASTAGAKKRTREEVQVLQKCARNTIEKQEMYEMSDPKTRKPLQVFHSLSQAERITHIPEDLIQKICRKGGGVVKGVYFRFVHEPLSELPKKKGKKSARLNVTPLSASLAQRKNDKKAVTTLSGRMTQQAAGQGKTNSTNSGLSLIQDRTLQKIIMDHQTAMGMQSSSSIPRFDLSTLRPVRRKQRPAVKAKKVIELVERASTLVLVCFRGATDVCRALSLDRKMVTGACHAWGTVDQAKYDEMFKEYSLRYVASGRTPMAYEYGAHLEDFRSHQETHASILVRFAHVFGIERAQRGASSADTIDIASRQSQSHGQPQPQETQHIANPNSQPSSYNMKTMELVKEADIGEEVRLAISVEPKTHAVMRDASSDTGTLTPTSLLCIFCQEKRAQIVFEPCHHCVVCPDCSETSCRQFCPICRTPISNRMQPQVVRLIRPRIYSAYSFM